MKPKRLLALGVLLAGVTAASVTGAQKSAPPQLTEQQKLKERVEAHDSDIKALKEKADRAAFEKDRIDKIQQHYEDYYEKVHTTEMHVLEAITAVFALLVAFAALFGYSVFDQRIQTAVSKATDDLETKLKEWNAAQLKQLEGSIQEEIRHIGENLDIRGKFSSYSLQGMGTFIAHQDDDAVDCFRKALELYLRGKARHLFGAGSGAPILNNLFNALRRLNPTQPENAVKKELADPLYDSLQQELAIAALEDETQTLAPLIKERKATPPPAPATTQKSPEPTPDMTQTSKTEQGEKK